MHFRGPFRGSFRIPNPHNIKQIVRTIIVRTSGICFENISKHVNFLSKDVPIYSQIHRIRIRYSKYQFIVQNTTSIPKYISKLPHFRNNIIEQTSTHSVFYFVICITSIIHMFFYISILYILYIVYFMLRAKQPN